MLTGCIDMMCYLKNNDGSLYIALVDIKTTSNISHSWSLQTAAYQMLAGEVGIHKRIALNLPKTGSKVKVVEYSDYENDLRMYLNCLELYRYLNPPKKVKEIDFSVD